MVLGSFSILGKPERNRLKLQLHVDRSTTKVKNSDGLKQRRSKVEMLKRAKELKKTAMKARELGLRTEEVTRLRKVFNEVDDDHSGEINLEELCHLCQTIQHGRLAHLSKWDLQQYLNEVDDDNSGSLDFNEFLQLVSPRRDQFREIKQQRIQKRIATKNENINRMRNSRYRYAWNLYNKYQTQVNRFGRKQGYTQESLDEHVKQFEKVDEDGSGELDVDEVLKLFKTLGNNNGPTREEAQLMMRPFDWRRVGRIDLMGFLEMMSPRRKKNLMRNEQSRNRMMQSLHKQKMLSKNVPKKRLELEQRHANAALKRWSRKLGFKDADLLTLKRQFNQIDTDGSGEIDVNELHTMLQTSHFVPNHLKNKTIFECRDIMDQYDGDSSGK